MPKAATVMPALLHEREAAHFLSVSPSVIRMLVTRGEIVPVRIPGFRRIAYATDDLRALVAKWKRDCAEQVS